MAFPSEGWPPPPATGLRSIRFYVDGNTTANFSDNAFLFSADTAANMFFPTPFVPPGGVDVVAKVGNYFAGGGSPMGGGRDPRDANIYAPTGEQAVPFTQIWSNSIKISNDGNADIEFSFDGVNVHGVVKVGERPIYPRRYEAGICVRNPGAFGVAFRIEAW